MFRKHSAITLLAITFILVTTFVVEPALSNEYQQRGRSRSDDRPQREERDTYTSERDAYTGDRTASGRRLGSEVDDWVERGASAVTDSPKFRNGIRLAAHAGRHGDEYGLASAIYFFDVPAKARSIKIKLYYEGESGRGSSRDSVGRVWIRNVQATGGPGEKRFRRGKGRDDGQPLYGDTFSLSAGKRHEEIVITARDHTLDGAMELHVIAEGRQVIDLKHMEVKTYRHPPDVRVITREHRGREQRQSGIYWNFYAGSAYHFGDRHYVRYTYPRHGWAAGIRWGRGNISIRRAIRPFVHARWSWNSRSARRESRDRGHARLRNWTPTRERDRRRHR